MSYHCPSICALNNNGGTFVELNGLIIEGPIFPNKNIQKITWNSPVGFTKNQTDHLCFRNKNRSSLIDVRAFKGEGVAIDHNLCKVSIKLKFQK